MSVVLWILTILLALVFLAAGLMKVTQPKQALAGRGMGWADDFGGSTVKGIGIVEVVGAVGLILPHLTGIAPVLTPIAALGLTVTMVVAIVVHLRRKESFVPPLVLAILSLVAAIIGFIAL